MICQSAQIFVFAMEVICLIISQVIYNDSKDMSYVDKCKIVLLIEGVAVLITLIIYIIEYKILNSIDSKKDEQLKKLYYIECDSKEKEEIGKVEDFMRTNSTKYLFVYVFVLFFIRDYWMLGIVFAIIAHFILFKKYEWVCKIAYKEKGMFIDALFNIVTAFGVIIYVLCRNDIFIIPVNKYIVEMVYLAMLCVPYTCLDMKVKGLSRRIRVINKN